MIFKICYKKKIICIGIDNNQDLNLLHKEIIDDLEENLENIPYWLDLYQNINIKYTDDIYDYRTISQILGDRIVYCSYHTSEEYNYLLDFDRGEFCIRRILDGELFKYVFDPFK